jgi:hypothetical protein
LARLINEPMTNHKTTKLGCLARRNYGLRRL